MSSLVYYRLVINTVGPSAKNQIKGSLIHSLFADIHRPTHWGGGGGQTTATAQNTSSHSMQDKQEYYTLAKLAYSWKFKYMYRVDLRMQLLPLCWYLLV